jgi:hypothetical protein
MGRIKDLLVGEDSRGRLLIARRASNGIGFGLRDRLRSSGGEALFALTLVDSGCGTSSTGEEAAPSVVQ